MESLDLILQLQKENRELKIKVAKLQKHIRVFNEGKFKGQYKRELVRRYTILRAVRNHQTRSMLKFIELIEALYYPNKDLLDNELKNIKNIINNLD